MAYRIVEELCTSCGDCETVCPTDSIGTAKGVYVINPDTCTECEDIAEVPQCLSNCLQDDCIVPV